MPTIIDANCCAKTFNTPPDRNFTPILQALFKNKAKLVCGGRLLREYKKVNSATKILKTLDQAGVLIILNCNEVDKLEETLIAEGVCSSDDQHIIAIAKISNARLLCSHDQALHQDFQNKRLLNNPRGAIYQDDSHKHLIEKLAL